jgi:cardiolipin synthase C
MQVSPSLFASLHATPNRQATRPPGRLAALLFSALLGVWVAGCASLPKDVERPISTALANPGETRLGQAVAARAAKAGTRNDSGFALVSSAELAFTSRMTLIKAAQKTLDIQYYAIFADDTTERMFDALREAAARGVRIRILLDDFNTSGKNAQVLKLAFEQNMEMRLFNPLPGGRGSLFFRIIGNLNDVQGMQRRMHNKIFVADNAVAITGGRNLGETYFGQSAGTNFIDIDLLAAGRMARDLSRSFDQYWNNPLAYPVQSLMTVKEIEALKTPAPARPGNLAPNDATDANANVATAPSSAKPPTEPGFPGLTEDPVAATSARKPANPTTAPRVVTSPTGVTTTLPALPDDTDLRRLTWTWAPSVMLVDKPSKIDADVDSVEEAQDTTVDGLLGLMSQARKDLLIVSPYFVPGERMMKQLADIRQRGVRVRVLTNSLASNDAPAAHVGYARYREALLGQGIELYEMRAEQPGTVRSLGSLGGSLGNLGSGSLGSGGGSRASLHAKVVVIDDRLLVVGSMNLDLRSQLQNSEVAIVVRNRGISAEATRLIEPALANGAYRVELDGGRVVWRAPQNSGLKDTQIEPDASTALKLLLKVIGPLAPDEML